MSIAQILDELLIIEASAFVETGSEDAVRGRMSKPGYRARSIVGL
jgi:hypothetical protein